MSRSESEVDKGGPSIRRLMSWLTLEFQKSRLTLNSSVMPWLTVTTPYRGAINCMSCPGTVSSSCEKE
jgi:hypothetical protein